MSLTSLVLHQWGMLCFCLLFILFSDVVVLALLNQVKVSTQLSLLKFLSSLFGEG